MNAKDTLTVKEAYAAMHLFLLDLYNQTGSDYLGMLLGSLCLLEDGNSADPDCWPSWIRAVEKSKGENIDLGLHLGDPDFRPDE